MRNVCSKLEGIQYCSTLQIKWCFQRGLVVWFFPLPESYKKSVILKIDITPQQKSTQTKWQKGKKRLMAKSWTRNALNDGRFYSPKWTQADFALTRWPFEQMVTRIRILATWMRGRLKFEFLLGVPTSLALGVGIPGIEVEDSWVVDTLYRHFFQSTPDQTGKYVPETWEVFVSDKFVYCIDLVILPSNGSILSPNGSILYPTVQNSDKRTLVPPISNKYRSTAVA